MLGKDAKLPEATMIEENPCDFALRIEALLELSQRSSLGSDCGKPDPDIFEVRLIT